MKVCSSAYSKMSFGFLNFLELSLPGLCQTQQTDKPEICIFCFAFGSLTSEEWFSMFEFHSKAYAILERISVLLSARTYRMLKQMLGCCKVYISESRNRAAKVSIELASKLFPGAAIVNKFEDITYNGVGYTMVSKLVPDPSSDSYPLKNAVFSMIKAAFEAIDLKLHGGTHPRLGVVDHVCFHPLALTYLEQMAGIAKPLADDIGCNLRVPTFLYGAAHEEGRKLDSIRRAMGYFKPNANGNQWRGGLKSGPLPLKPDKGPDQVIESKGVINLCAVGGDRVQLEVERLAMTEGMAVGKDDDSRPICKNIGVRLESAYVLGFSQRKGKPTQNFRIRKCHHCFLTIWSWSSCLHKDKKKGMKQSMLICCKLYISESRNLAALDSIERAARLDPETAMVNKFLDRAYNRVTYTLVSHIAHDSTGCPIYSPLQQTVVSMVEAACQAINLELHSGAHPRLGVVDDIIFHPLAQTSLDEAAWLARSVAGDIGNRFQLPIFLYGAAHPLGKAPDAIRRELGYYRPNFMGNQWAGWALPEILSVRPDEGPVQVSPARGIAMIGACPWVAMYNVPIISTDVSATRRIARMVSARGGGLPGVQTLGLFHGEESTEIACILLEPNQVGADRVQNRVELLAAEEGLDVEKGYFTDCSQEMLIDKYMKLTLDAPPRLM
ncbi:Formiminotransferase, N-terminal subdomain [Dillenia turbinata]|uniref:Formiminotransferase, N-terminal subdomain n=1 Tax=Dillenia turbinata TaxID=194707 RepID=A0AAN8YY69_9MAGN